jgi:hypothetical protein
MKTGLPCEECREHYNGRVARNPLRISHFFGGIHNSILRWSTDLHNFVNIATDKPIWSVQQVIAFYGSGGSRADKIDEARCALEEVRGILGNNLFVALTNLLNIMGS